MFSYTTGLQTVKQDTSATILLSYCSTVNTLILVAHWADHWMSCSVAHIAESMCQITAGSLQEVSLAVVLVSWHHGHFSEVSQILFLSHSAHTCIIHVLFLGEARI